MRDNGNDDMTRRDKFEWKKTPPVRTEASIKSTLLWNKSRAELMDVNETDRKHERGGGH